MSRSRLCSLSVALMALAIAAPAFAQNLVPGCKSPVEQTWSDAHRDEVSFENRREVFRNAVSQLLNPIVTRICFNDQARAIGANIPEGENRPAVTVQQNRRRSQDASAAYVALAQCLPVVSGRKDLIGSLLVASSLEDFEARFATMYPGYVATALRCEALREYLAPWPIHPAAYSFAGSRPHYLNLGYFLNSPATAACRIVLGVPGAVPHDTSVGLALANAVNGTSIADTRMQLKIVGASIFPTGTVPNLDGIEVPIDAPGTYLLTVLLNKVQSKNRVYSVSLTETCSDKPDIIYFRDPVSRLGQVELEVH